MPNQRAEDQKLLTLPAKTRFISELDRNLQTVGYSNRSQFIRDAIIEKLLRLGIMVPKDLALSRPRAIPDQMSMGEKPGSKPAKAASSAGKKIQYRIRKSPKDE